ncbi:CHAT domain-containing tetratricopeptide repeat protein [Isoalcanivorax indicus]|uniref:CHAT domain-containing tetratricopeptide repeat protein n=1 Tax=Isoalcanivorax indicus TaxID=2202653 RepID=UPI000DBAB164|nr:CHAT domain-containing protein [Isoalcanivorax indicus]
MAMLPLGYTTRKNHPLLPLLCLLASFSGCASLHKGTPPSPVCSEPELEATLAQHRQLGDRHGEAETLHALGYEYEDLGQYACARSHYEQALALHRELGDRSREGGALQDLGDVSLSLGALEEAREHYQQALQIHREVAALEAEGTTHNNLGIVYERLAFYPQAMEHYQQALLKRAELGDLAGEARSRRRLALLYQDLGQYAAALTEYQQVLVIAREISDDSLENVRLESEALFYIGTLYQLQGNNPLAVETLSHALDSAQQAEDISLQALIHNNLYVLYGELGQYALALTHGEQALARYRAQGDRDWEGRSLMHLGVTHHQLGQSGQALEYYQQAIEIMRDSGDRDGERAALNNRANALQQRGQLDAALAHHKQALRIARRTHRRHAEAASLYGMGSVYEAQGKHARALRHYQQAQTIYQDIGFSAQHSAAFARGRVLQKRGHYEQALAIYEETLIAADMASVPALQWQVNHALQQLLLLLNRPYEAAFYGKRAVNAIQSLRAGAQTLDAALQMSLLADKRVVYTELADLLISQGRLGEAEQILGLLKEQEYVDFVRRDQRATGLAGEASSNAFEAPWAARYQEIGDNLAALGREYGELSRVPRTARDASQQARYQTLQADLAVARQAYQTHLQDLRSAFAALGPERAMAFAEHDLDSLRALQGTLRQLGPGTVLLHYLVTPERLRILVTTADVQLHRDSAISEAELNRLILAYRQVLQDPRRDPQAPARALYDVLIAPVHDDLQQAQARVLMLGLDANLRYLPLAALHSGERWLVEDYALSIYTAAARANLTAPPRTDWRVAGLGVSEAAAGFSALPAVPFELHSVVRDPLRNPDGGMLHGSIHLDGEFDADALTEILEDAYPVVHIASHFHFGHGTEADSFLVLGNDQRLSLEDFRHGAFPLHEVDLLTLSACDTAVGGPGDNGREVEGFGVMAQRQGARAVIATLWPVADASTGLFMQQFYDHRVHAQTHKAEALRRAQLALLGGQMDLSAVPENLTRGLARPASGNVPEPYITNPDQPFSHPYYWAPFILMGNWL